MAMTALSPEDDERNLDQPGARDCQRPAQAGRDDGCGGGVR